MNISNGICYQPYFNNNYSYQLNKYKTSPSFKANIAKLPLENAYKLRDMVGYGSAVAIGILAYFGIDYLKRMDNTFNEPQDCVNGEKLIERYLENPENENDNLNYHANIRSNFENSGVIWEDFGVLYKPKEKPENILSKDMHKRIAHAVCELVKIPEFRDKAMANIESSDFEVTPENISFVEKVINTPKLLYNDNLRKNIAVIIKAMNHPRFKKTNCVEQVNKILDQSVNDKNPQFDNIGSVISARFSRGDFR